MAYSKSQQYLLDFVKNVGGQTNHTIYKTLIDGMDKKTYRNWVETYIRNGRIHLMVPHEEVSRYTVSKSLSLLKQLGGTVFAPLQITDEDGTTETPVDFYVIDLPVRIPTQTVDKGAAVSESKAVNPMTGQMNSASKLTSPETGLLFGLGLKETLKEMIKVRGGDQGMQTALNTMLSKTGSVSMEDIERFSSGRTSTETLDMYFKGIHIKLFGDM